MAGPAEAAGAGTGIEPLNVIIGAAEGVGALPAAWAWAEPTCSQAGAQA
jgi:hypothetical protein